MLFILHGSMVGWFGWLGWLGSMDGRLQLKNTDGLSISVQALAEAKQTRVLEMQNAVHMLRAFESLS